MEEQKSKWKELKKKLKNSYRLVILNNETLQEVNNYELTLLNVYVLLCSLIVAFGILFYALFALTPLKRTIPGYGKLESNREVVALFKQVNELEQTVESQKTYIQKFRHYVTGQVETYQDTLDYEAELPIEKPVERVQEDEILRKEIEREQKMSANSADTNNENFDYIHFISPVNGTISTHFKPEIEHYGVDILAPKNTAVKSIIDGVVIASDWTLKTGNTITIQHSNNLISSYKHNSTLLKQVGDHVKAGEAIAIIGNSGTLSNGPHLHFELWKNGLALNPEKYLRFD